MLPAVKARILNSESWNIGSETRVSITAKAARRPAPPISVASTSGLVQPIVRPP